MTQCPVCETQLPDPLPPFCDQCGWDINNDLTMGIIIGDIPDSVIEEYKRRLATAKRIWSEKAVMAEKLRELEQRLDESEKQREEEKAELEKKLKEAPAKERQQKEVGANWIEPITGMEFVYVPGGTFMMGDVFGDGYNKEKPVHEVTLDDFYIGRFPVTQGQWEELMGSNPSKFPFSQKPPIRKPGLLAKIFRWETDNDIDDQDGFLLEKKHYPVETVSWHDAMNFIEKLQTMNANDFTFDLPTEAQWEYAARSGGKKERYAGGEDIDALAWYDGNSGGKTHPVGRKRPNGLGLHDMSGNVWEWCRDWYGGYPSGAVRNPVGPAEGSSRVHRGGSWGYSAGSCRSARRSNFSPGDRSSILGFRLVRPPGR